jgi:hypothetical protein
MNSWAHNPEDGGGTFFGKVEKELLKHTAHQPGRPASSIPKHVCNYTTVFQHCHFQWVMRQAFRLTSAAVFFLSLTCYTSDQTSGCAIRSIHLGGVGGLNGCCSLAVSHTHTQACVGVPKTNTDSQGM